MVPSRRQNFLPLLVAIAGGLVAVGILYPFETRATHWGVANNAAGVSVTPQVPLQTYSLTCVGNGGTTSQNVDITVLGPNLRAGEPSVTDASGGTPIAGRRAMFRGQILNPSEFGATASANATFANMFQFKRSGTPDWGLVNPTEITAVYPTANPESLDAPVDGAAAIEGTYDIPANLVGNFDVRLCVDMGDGAWDNRVREWNENDNCGENGTFTIETPITAPTCWTNPASPIPPNTAVTWLGDATGGTKPYDCTWSGDITGTGCSLPSSGYTSSKSARVRVSSKDNPSNYATSPLCQITITYEQCNDDLDNDNDGAADEADPGCHTDSNPNNPASFNAADNDESRYSSPATPDLRVAPEVVEPGQTVRIWWSTSNSVSCSVDANGVPTGWTGLSIPSSSAFTRVINTSTTFTLKCVDVDFRQQPDTTDTVTVRLNPERFEQ